MRQKEKVLEFIKELEESFINDWGREHAASVDFIRKADRWSEIVVYNNNIEFDAACGYCKQILKDFSDCYFNAQLWELTRGIKISYCSCDSYEGMCDCYKKENDTTIAITSEECQRLLTAGAERVALRDL